MAHICGDKTGSNRHDPTQSDQARDDYRNLILLCPDHHTEIDKKENEGVYGVAALQKMKSDHEASVDGRLKNVRFNDKRDVAKYVSPLLSENRIVFEKYGPHSEIARKNPESDAHRIWLAERFSTLVPNNRKIAEIMNTNRRLFATEEQAIVSEFLLHARSYERWVNDEITYEGVIRFPPEFEKLITEVSRGG